MSIKDLQIRGLIKDFTHVDETLKLFSNSKVTFYLGIDATADSLHVGHLVGLTLCKRLQELGHTPIILLGVATATIGDPTGKSEQRNILHRDVVKQNSIKLAEQIRSIIPNVYITTNEDLLDENFNFLQWITVYGSFFKIKTMINSFNFKDRLDKGLTFLEFSYMLLQAYDFYYLNATHACTVQIGGSDQWSNILAGVELINNKANKPAFGITSPLLLNSIGHKMGKTSGNAIWLSGAKTSPYEFYQYWRNIDDKDVQKMYVITH